jgi:hypothetical protein
MQITDKQLSEISAAMAFAHYFVSDLERDSTEQAKKDYEIVFNGLRALAEVYLQGDAK